MNYLKIINKGISRRRFLIIISVLIKLYFYESFLIYVFAIKKSSLLSVNELRHQYSFNNFILVLGYNSPFDGGGGIFRWNSLSEKDDDGGLIFKQESQLIGRWERVLYKVIDIRYFGFNSKNNIIKTSIINKVLLDDKSIFFPKGKYFINDPIQIKNDNITIFGEGSNSILISDDVVFRVQNCKNIKIYNLNLKNKTIPYLIDRFKDGHGYQPTINDTEFWPNLPSSTKTQDLGPKIFINSCNQINILNIIGDFISIIFWNCNYSSVKNCKFRAGKNFVGGIVFWRDSKILSSSNNLVENNIVSYPSFSGVVFAGSEKCICKNNIIIKAGESGYKTWQGFINKIDGRCKQIIFIGNIAYSSFYDGFDISSDYPHTGKYLTETKLIKNVSLNNYRTGYYLDGKSFIINGNLALNNGITGFGLDIGDSSIAENFTKDNNIQNEEHQHEMYITGRNNKINHNYFVKSKNHSGYGLYIAQPKGSSFSMNMAINCKIFKVE